jgi:probable rRNA maturation factor
VITVHIANQQRFVSLDRRRLRRAVSRALREAGVADAELSIAVVDDAAIAVLHGRYLDDPTPTDVLSFPLDSSPGRLEGQIVVSGETALRRAPRYGWPAADELLLYVIHGALHLVGYDDATPADRRAMRRRERELLAAVNPHFSQ